MISFRYHLVTVIGLFLAIALGVVIGTSALNGAVVGDLHRQISDLKAANSSAAAQSKQLQAQAGDADVLAKTYGAKILGGTLAKKSVAIVTVPGAPDGVADKIAGYVTAAGATVTVRVALTKAFSDPARGADIKAFATSGAHPARLQLPPTTDPGQLGGALLSYVLFKHGQQSDLISVLNGFNGLGMLSIAPGTPSSADAVIVVGGGPLAVADPGGQMLLNVLGQLGSASGGPTVVTGDTASATEHGLVSVVRADPVVSKAVSTIDGVESPVGQVAAVLAVGEALTGHSGSYGSASGVDGLLPGAGA